MSPFQVPSAPVPWPVTFAPPTTHLALGGDRFDVRHRAVVVGQLPRPGAAGGPGLEAEAERLVEGGADALELTAERDDQSDGPDPIASLVAALRARVDVPLAVVTSEEPVIRAALGAGAAMAVTVTSRVGSDHLAAVVDSGGSLLLVHDGPATAEEAAASLGEAAGCADAAGLPRERVVLDPGLGLVALDDGSIELLRGCARLAALGRALSLELPTDLAAGGATPGPTRLSAQSLGIALGCRVLRTQDVHGARRAADVMAAVLEARRQGTTA